MKIVTFSGLDGCGKSTQVAALAAALSARGYRVYRMVTLYASVTGWMTLLREERKKRSTKRPKPGSIAPSNPAQERYPRGRAFLADRVTYRARLRRLMAYPLDCIALTLWLWSVRLRGVNVVICDRYLCDKLVNLPSPAGLFARILRYLVPRPDASFLLEVDPAVASVRRPEHTMDYFAAKDAGYRELAQAGFELEMVPGGSAAEMQRYIISRALAIMQRERHSALAPEPDIMTG
jgi:thymidylate kinase